MSISHKKIKNAFIDWVVPLLLDRGFRGVFPNYRRYGEGQIDIISLQFSIFDKAFCIGIAKCPVDGITYSNGEILPGDLVTANHCPRRFMLGTKDGDVSHWFKFEPTRHELRDKHKFPALSMYGDSLLKYKKIVDDVMELIELEAEQWWQNSEEWWHKEAPVYNKLFFDFQKLVSKQLYV